MNCAAVRKKTFRHKCAVCGRRFASRQWNSRYCCGSCRKEAHSQMSAAVHRRLNAKRKRNADAARHERGDLSLADVIDADFKRRVDRKHREIFGEPKRPGEQWRRQDSANFRSGLTRLKDRALLDDLDRKKLQDAINAAR
jgi:hypothetical protein